MYMKDLAAALVHSTSGVTRIVDNLERGGHARREPAPANRRATQVVLTDEGLAALAVACSTHVRGVRRHFARHLTSAQALATAFRSIADDLDPGDRA
jgi:DNA-binding MarR family transcriptional regulator